MAKYFLFACCMFVSGLFFMPSAHAKCILPQLAGVWEAPNTLKGEPKRVQIIHRCSSGSGSSAPLKGAEWTIRAFHECRPKNCLWGREKAKKDSNGEFHAVFETFSARRYVTIIPQASHILVKYKIDYRSAGKRDLRGKMNMWRVD